MVKSYVIVMSGILLLFVLSFASTLFAGGFPSIRMTHMQGSLLINSESIQSIFYLKKDSGAHFLRIMYESDSQGKELSGTEAEDVWTRIQGDKALSQRFLWLQHMKGTLGIPYRTIRTVWFSPAEGEKKAKLRIVYSLETKVIEGTDAETVWKDLQ